ncbi:MAG: cyclic nucleotide-binding domain-containing protein, partial [Bryobacteraceae bacterium]
YVWSHAGDGGYLTFASNLACIKAIDIAFSVVRKIKSKEWVLTDGRRLRVRMGLHAGFVQDVFESDLEGLRAVSGCGINMAARVLTLSTADQLLISKEYYDEYIKDQRDDDFEIGPLHSRSVKHGVKVEVMNANLDSLCLSTDEAAARQWQALNGLWQQAVSEYESLLHDSLRAGSTLTALAAAKYLLTFRRTEIVQRLCRAIGRDQRTSEFDFPFQPHELFSRIPADALLGVIEMSHLRLVDAGAIICQVGDPADTCFFPVSGRAIIERPDDKNPLAVELGKLAGELPLWMPGLKRAATIRASDTTLIIEFPMRQFRTVLEEAGCQEVVYEHIRRRVISNVTGSPDLFAGVKCKRRDLRAICEKHLPGAELDISSTAYVLFNGRIEINPLGGPPIQVAANGQASADTVAGIVTSNYKPDGDIARVLEESVAVALPHSILLELQQKHPEVRRAWAALCGVRLSSLEPCNT